MFEIASSTATTLMASVSTLITNTSSLWALAIAIPVGFAVIGYLKGLFTRGRKA